MQSPPKLIVTIMELIYLPVLNWQAIEEWLRQIADAGADGFRLCEYEQEGTINYGHPEFLKRHRSLKAISERYNLRPIVSLGNNYDECAQYRTGNMVTEPSIADAKFRDLFKVWGHTADYEIGNEVDLYTGTPWQAQAEEWVKLMVNTAKSLGVDMLICSTRGNAQNLSIFKNWASPEFQNPGQPAEGNPAVKSWGFGVGCYHGAINTDAYMEQFRHMYNVAGMQYMISDDGCQTGHGWTEPAGWQAPDGQERAEILRMACTEFDIPCSHIEFLLRAQYSDGYGKHNYESAAKEIAELTPVILQYHALFNCYPANYARFPKPEPVKPTGTIKALNVPIQYGAKTTLVWTSKNAVSATINGQSVAINGTMEVSPKVTTEYTLALQGDTDSFQCSDTVGVIQPPKPSIWERFIAFIKSLFGGF